MTTNRRAKEDQIKEISAKISAAKSLVVAEYAGLTVKNLQALRKDLKAKGVELKVYKNRLFRVASNEAGYNLDESLIGPNIYAFGMEDDISPAKVLAKFAKNHEALKLKAGIYEGSVIDSTGVAEIALLPSLEEALTMLATSLLAPVNYIGKGLHLLTTEGKLEAKEDATDTPEVSSDQDAPEQESAATEETKEETKTEETTKETNEVPTEESKTEEPA